MDQLNRILNARLGSEIDFIVKGYDNETRSVVGSRREAMLRKRQTFYFDTDEMGEHLIYEGRVVQARVVAVAEKVIRVEVFGVETSIVARGLSWEWIGNARDHFNVGDRILVRVLKINRTDLEHLTIRVDARSVSATNSHDNLKKCMPNAGMRGGSPTSEMASFLFVSTMESTPSPIPAMIPAIPAKRMTSVSR